MAGFGAYLTAAFNARPLGMPVPPNWLLLAGVGLLGWFVHPGLWLAGAGLEAGYLFLLATNLRFQRVVEARLLVAPADDRRAVLLGQLDGDDRSVQQDLEERCRRILAIGTPDGGDALRGQQEGQLAELCWLHLRLLTARAAVRAVARTGGSERDDLTRRLAELERRRDQAPADLAGSLEGQAGIVRARLAQFAEAASRLTYLDTEIDRLRQQADLLRDQALLAASGAGVGSVSTAISSLGDSLETTNRWMRDQQLTADAAWEQAPPLPRAAARATG